MNTTLPRRRFLVNSGKAGLALATATGLQDLYRPHGTIAAANKSFTLNFWAISYWNGITGAEKHGKPGDYYNWQIETFQKSYPNVTINTTFIPSSLEGWAKLDSAVAAGSPPDVMWGQQGNVIKYSSIGNIQPLNGLIPSTVYNDYPASLRQLISDTTGHTLLWPYGMAVGGGILINRDLFKKVGAESLLPHDTYRNWTYDQFVAAAKATTTKIDGQQVYGLALMTDWIYQVLQFIYGFGADLYDAAETKMTVNSPAGIQALQWLVDLEHKYHVAAPGTAGRLNEQVLRMFTQQQIAIYPSQAYYTTAFRTWMKTGTVPHPFSFMYVEPPHLPGKNPGTWVNTHGYFMAKQQDQDKLQMAARFVEHLTRPEALRIVTTAQGVIPPQRSLWSIVQNDPDRRVEAHLAGYAHNLGRRLQNDFWPRITATLDSAFSQRQTPQQALNDLVSLADRDLKAAIQHEGGH